MRVAIHTLGCKVNQLESCAMDYLFASSGAEQAGSDGKADVYIVNTCAVTGRASCQSRQTIRRLLRENEGSTVVATGCCIQADIHGLSDVYDSVFMVGNSWKHLIPSIILNTPVETLRGSRRISDMTGFSDITLCNAGKPVSRTRAYLKIQDGCNAFCSYCIVPFARGRSRSLAPESVMNQVEKYVKAGIKEIVVTGIHVGMYGCDLIPSSDIMSLIMNLCRSFPDTRFRLSSIEPTEIMPDFISWACETANFCPHWHIPLQSGSDRILALMNRRYDISMFMDLLSMINKKMPDAAIGVDVMAGFPSETEEDFIDTLHVVRNTPITYVHAFPYSIRPGTSAANMKDQIPAHEKKKRVSAVRMEGWKKRIGFYRLQKNSVRNCLIEQQDGRTGMWKGFTENYLPVLLEDDHGRRRVANCMVKALITDVKNDRCIAIPLDKIS